MNTTQSLFDLVANISQENFEKNSTALISNISSFLNPYGLQITFFGNYEQSTKKEESKILKVPFVVAQNIDQLTDTPDGILSGLVFEPIGPRVAIINGQISNETIKFRKQYKELLVSDDMKKFLLEVRNTLSPESKGRSLLNKSVITYQGNSSDKGKSYTGTWSFNSKIADLATEGNFFIQDYFPKNDKKRK